MAEKCAICGGNVSEDADFRVILDRDSNGDPIYGKLPIYFRDSGDLTVEFAYCGAECGLIHYKQLN